MQWAQHVTTSPKGGQRAHRRLVVAGTSSPPMGYIATVHPSLVELRVHVNFF